MNNERVLQDMVVLDDRWAQATEEVLKENVDLHEQIARQGRLLAAAVIGGELCIKALRQQTSEMNALDREVMEKTAGDIEQLAGDDHIEAVARRLAHHASRSALTLVKSRRQRQMPKSVLLEQIYRLH